MARPPSYATKKELMLFKKEIFKMIKNKMKDKKDEREKEKPMKKKKY